MARQTVYNVRWDPNRGKWYVKATGRKRKEFSTKKTAVNNAKAIAKKDRPSMVIVRTKTGSTTNHFEYK